MGFEGAEGLDASRKLVLMLVAPAKFDGHGHQAPEVHPHLGGASKVIYASGQSDEANKVKLIHYRESYGNHANSSSRVLETACDLIGVRVALDGEETLPRVIQVRKPVPAPPGVTCGAARRGYGTRSAVSRRVPGGLGAGRPRSTRT